MDTSQNSRRLRRRQLQVFRANQHLHFLTDHNAAADRHLQRITARQIEKLGLGVAFLDKSAITSEALKTAIQKLLTEPSYKAAAEQFSADMKTLGGAKASAEALLHFLSKP